MPLTWQGVRELAAGDVVEIGAHTVTHPVLARLDADEQAREVAGSRSELESGLGRPVTSFAYPYGGKSEYSAASIEAVRAAGFERACANVEHVPGRPPSIYELPRLIVHDWDARELLARIDAFLAQRDQAA
jgi:peptidoglycan/xylan/chitin deacetylase (PgdA/CDA1 family)